MCKEAWFVYIERCGLYMWRGVVCICIEVWFVYVGRNRTDIKVRCMEMCP